MDSGALPIKLRANSVSNTDIRDSNQKVIQMILELKVRKELNPGWVKGVLVVSPM